MSSERIGPPEHSTAYTPKPIGERERREDASSVGRKKKKKAKRRQPSEHENEEPPEDPDDSGDPPHLVDIRTAGKRGFRIET